MLLLNDVLDIESIRVVPQRNEEVEGIGSGQIIRAEIADPLWRVEINVPLSEFQDGRRVRAVLNDINRPQSFFRVSDPVSEFAANDPTGTLLASVTLGTRSGGQTSFVGQPSGYVFQPGDSFHIINAGRHYYFEISQEGTQELRTTPTVPVGIPNGATCVFVRPQIRVQMIPTELQLGVADATNWKMTSMQLRAIQKL